MPESEEINLSKSINIGNLAKTVMKSLTEYADVVSEEVKDAVIEAAEKTQKEVRANAPKDTGGYSKSWAVKKVSESPNSINVVVHSKGKYQLTHLLEFGHAKRNGGRVPGKVHIAPAEGVGSEFLVAQIERCLKRG